MRLYSFRSVLHAPALILLILVAGGSLLAGCSKPPEDPPVNAMVTDDGKPAPPEAANAPAAPGMDVEGKGGRGKGGP